MIAVIDFGMGNIHSCLKAISLYTDNFKLTTDPKDLENASGICPETEHLKRQCLT